MMGKSTHIQEQKDSNDRGSGEGEGKKRSAFGTRVLYTNNFQFEVCSSKTQLSVSYMPSPPKYSK